MTHTINSVSPHRPVHEGPLPQDRVIAELQRAIETLEQALSDLRDLSQQPGYDFAKRLLPGYEWALDQIGELNISLIFRSPSNPSTNE